MKGNIGLLDVARTRLGWLMALFFGLQSLQAYSIFGWFAELYRDAGFSAHTAGLLLGVITGISIPLSFLIPWLVSRMHNQTLLMCLVMGCYPLGYLGLIFAPASGALAWAVLVGIGTTTFPLILTLIGLRARTPAGTAALSGFAQSIGYLHRGHRAVRDRPAQRPLRRLDGAADRAAGRDGSAAGPRAGGVATGVRRGRAGQPGRRPRRRRHRPEILSVTGAVDQLGQRGKRLMLPGPVGPVGPSTPGAIWPTNSLNFVASTATGSLMDRTVTTLPLRMVEIRPPNSSAT